MYSLYLRVPWLLRKLSEIMQTQRQAEIHIVRYRLYNCWNFRLKWYIVILLLVSFSQLDKGGWNNQTTDGVTRTACPRMVWFKFGSMVGVDPNMTKGWNHIRNLFRLCIQPPLSCVAANCKNLYKKNSRLSPWNLHIDMIQSLFKFSICPFFAWVI